MKETLTNKYVKTQKMFAFVSFSLFIFMPIQMNKPGIRWLICLHECEGHHKTLPSILELSLLIFAQKKVIFTFLFLCSWNIIFPETFVLLFFSSRTQIIDKCWLSSITADYATFPLNHFPSCLPLQLHRRMRWSQKQRLSIDTHARFFLLENKPQRLKTASAHRNLN